jgi:hypothetical protein
MPSSTSRKPWKVSADTRGRRSAAAGGPAGNRLSPPTGYPPGGPLARDGQISVSVHVVDSYRACCLD